MSPKLRPAFEKSATVIDQLSSPNPRGTRTKKVRVALFSVFPDYLRIYGMLRSFGIQWYQKLSFNITQ